MPYRLNPKNRRQVQVRRGTRWVHKHTHKTVALARKHVSALNLHVHHPEKARKPKRRKRRRKK